MCRSNQNGENRELVEFVPIFIHRQSGGMAKGKLDCGDGSIGISTICHRRLSVVCGVIHPLAELSEASRFVRHWIPSSIPSICKTSFEERTSVQFVVFDFSSPLSRIEREAFCGSCLQSIHLPASVEVICERCFSDCNSLESISFDSASKLS
jgi:hypothetical protein